MSKTIIGFGELLWDLLPGGAKLGGAPMNFIYRIGELGNEAVMVSRLGDDEWGRQAASALQQAGLSLEYIQHDTTHPTGTVEVTLDANRQPTYRIIPDVAYDFIERNDSMIALAERADAICFGTLSQRAEQSRSTLHELLGSCDTAVKLLDINLRPACYSPAVIRESLDRADVVKLNDDEAYELREMFELSGSDLDELAGELVDRYLLTAAVITLGRAGAIAANTAGQVVYVPGYAVEVADPVGAGDAFTAGFLHQLLGGAKLAECCRFGNILGAMVARQEGGTDPLGAEAIASFRSDPPQRVRDGRFGVIQVD